MRLVVDAQLPKRLARGFATRGFDALHTLDLEQGRAIVRPTPRSWSSRAGKIALS